jgi:hypothetical protein
MDSQYSYSSLIARNIIRKSHFRTVITHVSEFVEIESSNSDYIIQLIPNLVKLENSLVLIKC